MMMMIIVVQNTRADISSRDGKEKTPQSTITPHDSLPPLDVLNSLRSAADSSRARCIVMMMMMRMMMMMPENQSNNSPEQILFQLL